MHLLCCLQRYNNSTRNYGYIKLFLISFVSFEFIIFMTFIYDIFLLIFWVLAVYYFLFRIALNNDSQEDKLYYANKFVNVFFQLLEGPSGEVELKKNNDFTTEDEIRVLQRYCIVLLIIEVGLIVWLTYKALLGFKCVLSRFKNLETIA